MARTLSAAGGGAIFPAGTAAFVKRRLSEGAGVVLIAAAVFLLAAFASYAPADPSLNSASGRAIHNLLGYPGAVAADLALQLFGVAAVVPVIVLAIWGWRLLWKQPVSHVWLRITIVIMAMPLLAVAASAVAAPESWPLITRLGGVVGSALLERATQFFGALVPYVDSRAIGLAGAALGFPALIGAIGFSLADGIAVVKGAGTAASMVRTGWRRSRAAVEGLRAAVPEDGGHWLKRLTPGRLGFSLGREGAGERVEPTLARRGDEPPDAPAAREPRLRTSARAGLVAPPAKTKASKRAEAARQGKLDLTPGEYRFPPLDLLDAPPERKGGNSLTEDALEQNAKLLASVLEDFGVKGEITKVRPGPVVTLYELEPAPGTKTSRVIGLSDDIARSMSAVSVRVAVVPGRNVIGIELPNVRRETVYLRELLGSDTIERSGVKLPLVLGKDIGGAPVVVDLSRMPHLLIAGTTGSGKSVAMNTMVLSLIYTLAPQACKFIMIDPKMLELSVYEGIPHLLCPVVTEAGKAVVALKWVVREMENRYRAMSQLGVRNIAGYNSRLADARRKGESLSRRVQTGFDEQGNPVFEEQPLATDPLPFIVVVVDEMADLMLVAGKDIEAAVQRLAQMARAAGIHLIMATQRPSVDVITGTIKANFPTRISFQVTSKIDSRTILGEQGAEQLLGQGDMLYMAGGGRISRVHGPFVSDEEVEGIVRFLKNQGEPEYIEAITEDEDEGGFALPGIGGGMGSDELYDQAVALVARERKASTSFIQRHLQIGYNRAARIIERMEAEGVVSQANRVGRREVLAGDHAG